jgi:hypothetical protein
VASTKSVPSTFERESHGDPRSLYQRRLVGQHRPKVRAADPDVHHVADPRAGVTGPRARADAAREIFHAAEHGAHAGHDVLAVEHDRTPHRRPERDVQDGASLGDVDPLAAEHRVDVRAQS